MDLLKQLIYRHLVDPTTYAGVAALLITYLPVGVTGIDVSQWEKLIGAIVGLALVWIDGRMRGSGSSQLATRVLPMLALCIYVLGAFALSSCGTLNQATSAFNNYSSSQLEASKKNIQAANDNVAKALSDALCGLPYGELVRNGSGNPNLPEAVIEMCGLPSGYTMVHSVPTTTITTGAVNVTIPTATSAVKVVPPS